MGAWETLVIDMSDVAKKRDLLSRLGRLQGLHELRLKRRHRVRSLNQNAWYWGCIVTALAVALDDQWGRKVTPMEAHRSLADKFLTQEIVHVNEDTGEVRMLRIAGSTAQLDTAEFRDYCENCRNFLAEWFRVEVPDPDQGYYEERGDSDERAA